MEEGVLETRLSGYALVPHPENPSSIPSTDMVTCKVCHPFSGVLMPCSDLLGHCTCIVHTHADKTPIHVKIKYLQKYMRLHD